MSDLEEKSVFLSVAGRIYDKTGLARLSMLARSWYGRQNQRLRGGWLGWLADDGYDRAGWLYRRRMRGMRMHERSMGTLLRMRAWRYLLGSQAGYLGLWLLLSGLGLLILSLITGHGHADTSALHACTLLILLSVPLMGCARPLSRLLREGRLLTRLLFEPCELFLPESDAAQTGEARPLGVLVGAALTVLAGGLLSARVLVSFLLLLPLCLVLLAIPEIALLCLVGGFPLAYLTPHPTAVLCILACLVHLSYFGKVLCGRRDFWMDAADLFVLLFCFLLLLGGLFGRGDADEGIVLSFLATLYFPARHLLLSARWRRRACLALATGALFCSLLGIYQYFFTDAVLLWTDSERFSEIGSRVTGVFDNPNILGVYLLLLFPVIAGHALEEGTSVAVRAFSLLCALAMLFCAVLTWSRGAWLALLAELLLLLLLSGRRTASFCLLTPLLLPIAIPLLPTSVLHRFASIASFADSSVRYRIYTWRGVMRMISEHPFGIGVGESAFRAVYPRYAVSGIESVMHAHQMPLQLTAELGLVGFVTLSLSLLLLIARGIGEGSCRGGAVAMCGAAVMGLFDHLWYAKGMIVLFFAVAAFTGREERV